MSEGQQVPRESFIAALDTFGAWAMKFAAVNATDDDREALRTWRKDIIATYDALTAPPAGVCVALACEGIISAAEFDTDEFSRTEIIVRLDDHPPITGNGITLGKRYRVWVEDLGGA